MMKIPFFFPAFLLLTLAACTPPSATRQYNPDVEIPPKRRGAADEAPPRVYEDSKSSEGQVQGGNSTRTAKSATPFVATATDSPAVLALVQEADASSASGRLDNAAATLERAIRIQPRNALLWQKLAEVRLQQHQPGLAEDLAKKSNILAKDNKSLSGKNWSIIADSRRQKGDAQGASEADAKAKR